MKLSVPLIISSDQLYAYIAGELQSLTAATRSLFIMKMEISNVKIKFQNEILAPSIWDSKYFLSF